MRFGLVIISLYELAEPEDVSEAPPEQDIGRRAERHCGGDADRVVHHRNVRRRWSFDFSLLWNYILTFIAYAIIFFCNIRNDNYAYRGILLFVFFMAFDQLMEVFYGGAALGLMFNVENPISIVLSVFYLLFVLSEAVVGFMLYYNITKYMMNPVASFKKVRLLAIVYSALLFIAISFSIAIFSVILLPSYTPAQVGLAVTLLLLSPISEVVMSVAIIFTLERLRRV